MKITLPFGPMVRLADDLVGIQGRDGCMDFVRFCASHKWASLPSVFRSSTDKCPLCALTGDDGHARFNQLQARLMPPEVAKP